MGIKSKIKDWYSTAPKRSIWYYGFWIMVIKSFLIPSTMYIVYLQLGAMAPDIDPTPTFEHAAKIATDSFLNAYISVFECGQRIASNNPLAGKIIVNLPGYLWVWGNVTMAFYLFNGIIRHFVVKAYQKITKRRCNSGIIGSNKTEKS